MMQTNLAGGRLLVVGGSSGIGLATAQMAAARGAAVTVAGRDAARLTAAAEAIGEACTIRPLDMTNAGDVAALFGETGPFDHVVVTAAQIASARVADLPLETAMATFDSKFWGPYRIARAAQIADGGSLTFVSGVAARRPRPGRVLVAAACAALETLTRGLAAELAPVRVNCVSPGLIDTPMLRAARPPGSAPTTYSYSSGRLGRPEEVAWQILACAENPFMTGAVIEVDGGLSVS